MYVPRFFENSVLQCGAEWKHHSMLRPVSGKEFRIGTAPPKVERKCVLSVIHKIQVVHLCLYVTSACYSWINLINWQSVPCFKTDINYKVYWSYADTVILPMSVIRCISIPAPTQSFHAMPAHHSAAAPANFFRSSLHSIFRHTPARLYCCVL